MRKNDFSRLFPKFDIYGIAFFYLLGYPHQELLRTLRRKHHSFFKKEDFMSNNLQATQPTRRAKPQTIDGNIIMAMKFESLQFTAEKILPHGTFRRFLRIVLTSYPPLLQKS
jgi:hypothetical protein